MKHREKRILIEFQGAVSSENRRYLLRRVAVRTFFTVFGTLLIPSSITLLILVGEIGREAWWLFGAPMGALSIVGSVAAGLHVYTKKEQRELFPTRICFYADSDRTVIFDGPSFHFETYYDEFRKVVDMGDYYYIDIPGRSGRGYVCQKNLMAQGKYRNLLISITDDPEEAIETVLSFQ